MPTDTTVQVKILPENLLGTFPLGSASYVSLTTASRYLRPYPPGNYAGSVDGLNNLTLTWVSRNRLTQTTSGLLVRQDAATITAESGTTYEIDVVVGGTVIRTIVTSSLTTVLAMLDRANDNNDPATNTDYRLYSKCGGLRSKYFQLLSFPGVAYPGGSTPVGAGRYEFTVDFPTGAGVHTMTGNGTATDPDKVIDGDDTQYCDLECDGTTSFSSAAFVDISGMSGIVIAGHASQLVVDYEVLQNDLTSDLEDDGVTHSGFSWRFGLIYQPHGGALGYHWFTIGAAGAGTVARTTATFSLDPVQDLRIVQAALITSASMFSSTGKVKVRIYGAYVLVS